MEDIWGHWPATLQESGKEKRQYFCVGVHNTKFRGACWDLVTGFRIFAFRNVPMETNEAKLINLAYLKIKMS